MSVSRLQARKLRLQVICCLHMRPGEEGAVSICLLGSLLPAEVSLIAQLVKNLPAVKETLVRFLGQED